MRDLTLARDTRHVNDFLHELGRASQVSIPLDRIDEVLTACGFDSLEPMILCGRDGSIHEPVGRNRWLALQWHKHESGRYEVNAYVS